jgi:hypothetical protein
MTARSNEQRAMSNESRTLHSLLIAQHSLLERSDMVCKRRIAVNLLYCVAIAVVLTLCLSAMGVS